MEPKLLLIPLISGFIGYITNFIAIKMLFRPKKKIFGYQGLIPKRKTILAKRLADASMRIMPKSFDHLKSIPYVGEKITDYFRKGIEEKINTLDSDEFEDIVMKTAKSEFVFIESIGFVLGFMIGLLQLLLI